jgi:hypothetical protein
MMRSFSRRSRCARASAALPPLPAERDALVERERLLELRLLEDRALLRPLELLRFDPPEVLRLEALELDRLDPDRLELERPEPDLPDPPLLACGMFPPLDYLGDLGTLLPGALMCKGCSFSPTGGRAASG